MNRMETGRRDRMEARELSVLKLSCEPIRFVAELDKDPAFASVA